MGYPSFIKTNVVLADPIRVRESAALPITLDQAKAYLKMTGIDDDDPIIEQLISEAVDWLETYCDISAVPQTVTAELQVKNKIYLPCGPVVSITTVTPSEDAGTHTVMSIPGDGAIKGCGIYTVVYEAGYPDGQLPAALKGALYSYIAYCYEHRGDNALNENAPEFAAQAKQKAFPFIKSISF